MLHQHSHEHSHEHSHQPSHEPSHEPSHQNSRTDENTEPEYRRSNLAAPESELEIRPDAQVEDFLDRVFSHLWTTLTYEERAESRNEIRLQIAVAVAANMEMGSTYSEALTLSLAQLRREKAIASQSVQQLQETRVRTKPSARQATIAGLGFFGLFYLLDQTRISGDIWSRLVQPLYGEGQIFRDSAAVAGFYRFELLVLPILCGLAVGLLAKYRPVRGTLNALGLLAIPAILWGGLAYGLSYAGIFPSTLPPWVQVLFPNPVPAVCGIGCWAALGALSAGAGGWLRRRMPKAGNAFRTISRKGRRQLKRIHWPSRRTKIA